jgi:hypothetical protein
MQVSALTASRLMPMIAERITIAERPLIGNSFVCFGNLFPDDRPMIIRAMCSAM